MGKQKRLKELRRRQREQSGESPGAQDALRASSSAPAAEAVFSDGFALHRAGRLDEAEARYRAVIARDPGHFKALSLLGMIRAGCGDLEEALGLLDRSLKIDPGQVETLDSRASVLEGLGRMEEALESLDKAIALMPDSADLHYNRGRALEGLKRFEEALKSYDTAIAIKADADAWYNKGNLLADLGRYDEALASFDRAIALRPDYAEAWYNKGNALTDLRRFEEAVSCYRRVVALRPGHANALWNTGLVRLMLGDYDEGLRLYEWRWERPDFPSPKRGFDRPLWLGEESLADRTVLLHAEQGLGDTIQFCRYANLVAGLGARVILEVQPALKSLIEFQGWPCKVIARGEQIPPFDFHCPLLSLPLAFKTRLDTIPAGVPYLKAAPADVERWRGVLGEKKKIRVGIAWAGSTLLKNDRNRSVPLGDLAKLAQCPVELISLQKDLRPGDDAILAASPLIRSFEDAIRDFSDTAAIVSLLDLVISVDTSVAHLAGAVGKPVWILLPFVKTDWRWLLDREDSRWYPTARLFHQPAMDDWESVISRIRRELGALAATP